MQRWGPPPFSFSHTIHMILCSTLLRPQAACYNELRMRRPDPSRGHGSQYVELNMPPALRWPPRILCFLLHSLSTSSSLPSYARSGCQCLCADSRYGDSNCDSGDPASTASRGREQPDCDAVDFDRHTHRQGADDHVHPAGVVCRYAYLNAPVARIPIMVERTLAGARFEGWGLLSV
ncbi:hypothetical protein F5Y04DRAFT_41042 [Hypomontagnella monticulosa]|nr:hypothetical protein F5Y04DRAFT_41042 [Hypomontagnella monticulosa]